MCPRNTGILALHACVYWPFAWPHSSFTQSPAFRGIFLYRHATATLLHCATVHVPSAQQLAMGFPECKRHGQRTICRDRLVIALYWTPDRSVVSALPAIADASIATSYLALRL